MEKKGSGSQHIVGDGGFPPRFASQTPLSTVNWGANAPTMPMEPVQVLGTDTPALYLAFPVPFVYPTPFLGLPQVVTEGIG
jgi:hypothetical protein